jgi:catechol 2,3-dioxygenase-like lactoylglutathione lyase family enzyme
MAITRLGIVSVPVSDPDRAITFYVGVLGCELLYDESMGPTMRWVQLKPSPDAQTTLTLVTWFPTMVPGSTKGLLFETDSLDEDVERIRAQGVVVSDINEEAWGRYASLDDPDGNGIILRGAVSPH